MAFYYKPLSILVPTLLLSCFISTTFVSLSEATKNGGFTTDLIHRDSRRSPSYNPSSTRFERLRNSFDRSHSRKSSINLASTRPVSKLQDWFDATLTPEGGEYLMSFSIGTPPVLILAVADTGSDLTWTQCKPCTQCYQQNDPLFDSTATTTYRSVSCTSQQCSSVGAGSSCDASNGCDYSVSYGDRSYSNGDLAEETFTFGLSPDETAAFPKIVFGCGHKNQGNFNETGSGIIGLGGGPVSIVRQLEISIGGKFSYCLAPVDTGVSSKISFGSNAIVAGPNVQSTPLISSSPSTFYYLTLEAISVGSQRLEFKSISKSSFNPEAAVVEGNIIIDSGTTLTYLPAALYDELEPELVNSINSNRVNDTQGLFRLCYELPINGSFTSPPIVAHFTGADLELPQASTFVEVQQGIACLTLVPSQDVAIFGNLHQINYHIGYDLENQKVAFLPTDCTKAQ